MANLTGNLKDVTNQTPSTVVSITVKAPGARLGAGSDLIVSSPAEVDFNHDTGALSLTGMTGGLSWLVIEGNGWSDTVALSVAAGMTMVIEAVANAAGAPALVDYVRLLDALENRVDAIAQGAVDSAIGTATSSIGSIDDRHANKFVRLNEEGKLFISTQSITGLNDPVNKQYADNVVGTTTSHISYLDDRFANQIVRLNSEGKLFISTASITSLNDPVNKKYVDDALGQVSDAVDSAIGTTTSTIAAVDDRYANQIVRLNAEGKLFILTSSITELNDPVNKQYADNVVGTTTSYISYTDDRFAGQIVRVNDDGKLYISTASITELNDPVNKQYVDSAILESSGGQTTWWN